MRNAVLFVDIFLFSLYLAGLCLLLRREFAYLKGRLSLGLRLYSYGLKEEGKFFGRLSSFVFTATGKEGKGKALSASVSALFLAAFFLARIFFNIFFSLVVALLAASVPAVSLVSKIQKQRNRSGKEGLSFSSALYREYLLENRNMYTALEKCAERTEGFPVSGRQAGLLCMRLRSARGKREAKNACTDFAKALGSGWARALSLAVFASLEGYDVSEALIEIISDLKEGKQEAEEIKRINSESVRMTLFLVPALYVFCILISTGYLGIGMRDLLRYQFGTPAGAGLFFSALMLFLLCRLLISFVKGDRVDI